MNTQILIVVAVVLFSALFILKDTISYYLFGGKSVLPNEMRGFKATKPNKLSSLFSKEENRLFNVFLDTLIVLIAVFVAIRLAYYIYKHLNF